MLTTIDRIGELAQDDAEMKKYWEEIKQALKAAQPNIETILYG